MERLHQDVDTIREPYRKDNEISTDGGNTYVKTKLLGKYELYEANQSKLKRNIQTSSAARVTN